MQMKMDLPLPNVTKDADVRTAAEEMRRTNSGALLIRDEDTVIGLITDRDLVVRVLADPEAKLEGPIYDYSTKTMFTCQHSDSLDHAALQMEENGVKYLLVMNDNHEAVGLLSLEMIAAQPGSEELVGEVVAACAQQQQANGGA
jgi:CBS domain-containing protein